MEDKILNEKESLLLIQQMISTAKKEQADNGISWIVWGWLLFLASAFTYINIQYNWMSTFFFWNLFGIAAILLVFYESARHLLNKKTEKVKTYTMDLFEKLNVGFGLSLMLIILSVNIGYPSNNVPPEKGFTLLLGLYGFWILIYGTVLNFKPSIIGAFITWGFAFAGLFVQQGNFDLTMLIHAAAVLCGYIIPGHIANVQFRKLKNKKF